MTKIEFYLFEMKNENFIDFTFKRRIVDFGSLSIFNNLKQNYTPLFLSKPDIFLFWSKIHIYLFLMEKRHRYLTILDKN